MSLSQIKRDQEIRNLRNGLTTLSDRLSKLERKEEETQECVTPYPPACYDPPPYYKCNPGSYEWYSHRVSRLENQLRGMERSRDAYAHRDGRNAEKLDKIKKIVNG